MEENNKENLYIAEDILEFLYNMCDRCNIKNSCDKHKERLETIQNQLFVYRNKKINEMIEKTGINF